MTPIKRSGTYLLTTNTTIRIYSLHRQLLQMLPAASTTSHIMATTTKIPQLLHQSYRPSMKPTSQQLSPLQIFLLPFLSQRNASGLSLKGKGEATKEESKKRKKVRVMYRSYDLKKITQFALCDAIRYFFLPIFPAFSTSLTFDLFYPRNSTPSSHPRLTTSSLPS